MSPRKALFSLTLLSIPVVAYTDCGGLLPHGQGQVMALLGLVRIIGVLRILLAFLIIRQMSLFSLLRVSRQCHKMLEQLLLGSLSLQTVVIL